MRRRFATVLAAPVVLVVSLTACMSNTRPSPADQPAATASSTAPAAAQSPPGTGAAPSTSAPAGDPLVAAAGDIACEPGRPAAPDSCQQMATSDILLRDHPDAVIALGDEQYVEGRINNYLGSYAQSWGRVLPITHPAPGDHDYAAGQDGYFAYFGPAAGPYGRGYYSFDIGSWHIIALDSECANIGGCDVGSPEEKWLADDLKSHPSQCILAYEHEPLFSSGPVGGNPAIAPFWRDLIAAHADVILNGDDHDYERFAPQNPDGTPNPNGIREFVVGTGGKSLFGFHGGVKANSEVRGSAFGVLELRLHQGSYDWRFVPIAGSTFTDAGSATCH